jgi:DNA-binding PadR family transcriptional regulator
LGLVVKDSKDSLTDLEGTIVSTLLRWPGESAYFVRQAFINSPSRFWSGSGGSIYPAIKRLEARGVLVSHPRKVGRKKSIGYELSDYGRSICLAWVGDPVRACDTGFDPFRLRLANLAFMSRTDQRRTLLAWRDEINASFVIIEQARKGAAYSAGFDLADRTQALRLEIIGDYLKELAEDAVE